MKLHATVEEFIAAKRSTDRSGGTVRGLELTLQRDFGAKLGDVPLEAVEPKHFDTWMEGLKSAGLAASSRKLYLVRVREFWRWAARRGYVERDPSVTIDSPKMEGKAPKFLSPAEYAALWNAADPSARDFFDFLVATGVRLGEALALKREDVRGEGIYLGARKACDWTFLPAAQELKDFLLALPAAPDGTIFSRSVPTYQSMFKRAAEVAGMAAKPSPHGLRHSCATWMVRAGTPVYVVKAQLGHSSVKTTEIYAKMPNGNWLEEYPLIPERTRRFQPLFQTVRG